MRMKKILFYFLVFSFTLLIFSCGTKKHRTPCDAYGSNESYKTNSKNRI